ncbi:cytochrome P450 monooxygenase [Akanthomyces lecanii RCEF 1005]|uniref:Cytochrome P450 monooxygenase n=1 Tax=Akanthomyces lecanii RCEF 1005 TaxID=1081108 RepID=A0A168FS72_CORDF|nr:cytochrome P450 monooxygenase [Akanthomyces lecanii RCEF 1005]
MYGDVVRVAPDELSFRTAQAWDDIYGFSANFPKDPRFFNAAKSGASNVGVCPTNEAHRRQRRVLGGGFSDMALKHQEPLLSQHVNVLIQKMHEKARAKSRVDVVEWFNYTTFDFMAEYVYGESLSCLEDARYHPFLGMKFVAVKAWTVISMSKYVPSMAWPIKAAAWYLYRDLLRNREADARFSDSKITERMGRDGDSSSKDYISHVRSGQSPKGSLSEDEIRANASFLMIAGSETTATALSGCTFLLLSKPSTYQELASQIHLRYQRSSDITFSSMADFPYLDAVLREALRMYPPTPLGMPRVVPEGGATIAGNFMPGKIGAHKNYCRRCSTLCLL